MNNELHNEIVHRLRLVLEAPHMFGRNPYAADSILDSLVPVAMALETGETFARSTVKMRRAVQELTKDVPSTPSLYRHLCEKRVIPKRRASFTILQERGNELCARLLKNWQSIYEQD